MQRAVAPRSRADINIAPGSVIFQSGALDTATPRKQHLPPSPSIESTTLMSETTCPQCGARYPLKSDSCTSRWHQLLGLDHSRKAPWGPLHALAFATFTLQHSDDVPPQALARCWEIVRRVVEHRESPAAMIPELRARGSTKDVPPRRLSADRAPHRFAVTIADLGDFPAETYQADLDRWARATHEAWRPLIPLTRESA